MDGGMYIFHRLIIFFSILKLFFSFHFYRPITMFLLFETISFSEERENTKYQAFGDSIFLYCIIGIPFRIRYIPQEWISYSYNLCVIIFFNYSSHIGHFIFCELSL